MDRIENNYLFVCKLKEILHDFNLPIINVWTKDTIPRETKLYIKDGWVVRCSNIVENSKGEVVSCKYNKLYEYAYNWPGINFTRNFIINSSNYDEYTHEYFGDYLRFLRDYHKVNFMGMYNCFYNQKPNRIYHVFKNDEKTIYRIDTDNKNYNYYVVPIKFDQVYTIAIDSEMQYDLACIFYNNMFVNDTPQELIEQSLVRINGSRFSRPFLYDTHFKCVKDHWRKEKNLKLVLKLPKSVTSSIVILEGNYRNQAEVLDLKLVPEFIYNTEEEYKVPIDFKDNTAIRYKNMYPTVYDSKNLLLRVNNHNSYPLSERILEYFVGCAIYPLDLIDSNVERVQLSKEITYYSRFGMWDDKLRRRLYDFLTEVNSEGTRHIDKYYDLTAYVDKDVENLLGLNKYE